jgi:hypothetical protein
MYVLGLSPVIYLTMNRTIRNECHRLCVAPFLTAVTVKHTSFMNTSTPAAAAADNQQQHIAMMNITRSHHQNPHQHSATAAGHGGGGGNVVSPLQLHLRAMPRN